MPSVLQNPLVRFAGLACVVAVCAFQAGGCGTKDEAGAGATTPLPTMTGEPLAGDFTPSGSGALNAANTLPHIDPALAAATSLAARIVYMSKSGITDREYPVSGTVFVPKGDPPKTGWPLVAFGHQATGIRPQCAPSFSPILLGDHTTVIELVKAGYVVSVPDYLGLGLDKTYHPFLDSTTEGSNLIDSLSAIKKLVPNTSRKWIAFGIGQGGQAAWAANELVENHSMGLDLVGAVSVSPTADIDGLADAAEADALTPEQKLALQGFLATLKKTYGKDFDLDAYRRGGAQQHWDALLACDAKSADERAQLAKQVGPEDLRPASPDALEDLRGFLRKTTLPQGPTSAPMLVVYGGQDPLIPRDWTERAVYRACQMGDVIQTEFQPDQGGGDVDLSGALAWMRDRFDGIAARDDCGSIMTTDDVSGNGER